MYLPLSILLILYLILVTFFILFSVFVLYHAFRFGLASRVNVMYAGYIIEEAPVKSLYANPQHPYTIGLLGSLPRMDSHERRRLVSIEGLPPVLYAKPTACPFAPRCHYRVERCLHENPPLMDIEFEHRAACWVDPNTGKER